VKNNCHKFKLHLDKFHEFIKYSLKHPFDKNSVPQSELQISIIDINRCYRCLSNQNICWFHAEAVKIILMDDAKIRLNELKVRN
jgi:hypothetical protein